MAEAIKVAVRVRPFNQREKDLKSTCVISMSGASTVVQCDPQPKTFTYDFSYWSHNESDSNFASQDTVMHDVGEPILDNAVKGFNCCLFAYGQTGSGKSYSIMGYGDAPGIIPRSVEYIFKQKEQLESNPSEELRIWITFIEIYNEQVRDLLHAGQEVVDLKVMDHPDLGVYIPGVTESPCAQANDVQKLMDFGTKKRVTAATNMNSTSSRSHAVFIIKVQRLSGDPPAEGKKDARKALNAKINLVDLAGSERVSKTGASGDTMKEGCAINQSLSALGMVIKELSEAMAKKPVKGKDIKDVVSFRASKLTFLLKDSLAGNSKTFMIAAISPASDNVEETISTLRFASSVKKIKTVAKQNLDKKDEMIGNLQAEIKKLRSRLGKGAAAVGGGALPDGIQEDVAEELKERERLLDQHKKTYEHQIEEAKHLDAAREEALKDMGLSSDEIDEVFGIDKDTPYLLNMSDDPSLTGCLMYILKPGMVTTVGSDPENTMVLKGLGIGDHLCQIEVKPGSQVVMSMPQVPQQGATKGRICVNGRVFTGEQPLELRHCDKIFFGRTYAMRLVIPSQAESMKGQPEVAGLADELHEQDLMKSLITEDSEAWGELQLYLEDLWQRLGEERGRDLFDRLSEASHLVDEANDITTEMRPSDRMKFEVELVWDIHRDARDIIVIRVMQFPPDGMDASVLCYWTLNKFKERLDMMRDCYDQFHHTGDWQGHGDSLEDPWLEPSLVEVKNRMHAEAESSVRQAAAMETFIGGAQADAKPDSSRAARPSAKGKAKAAPAPKDDANKKQVAGAKVSTGRTTSPMKKAAATVIARNKVIAAFKNVNKAKDPEPAAPEEEKEEILGSPITTEPMNGSARDPMPPPPVFDQEAAAVMESKETLIAVLRDQLKDKEDKEAMYKQQIQSMEQQLEVFEGNHGSLMTIASQGNNHCAEEPAIASPKPHVQVRSWLSEPREMHYEPITVEQMRYGMMQPRAVRQLSSRSPIVRPYDGPIHHMDPMSPMMEMPVPLEPQRPVRALSANPYIHHHYAPLIHEEVWPATKSMMGLTAEKPSFKLPSSRVMSPSGRVMPPPTERVMPGMRPLSQTVGWVPEGLR